MIQRYRVPMGSIVPNSEQKRGESMTEVERQNRTCLELLRYVQLRLRYAIYDKVPVTWDDHHLLNAVTEAIDGQPQTYHVKDVRNPLWPGCAPEPHLFKETDDVGIYDARQGRSAGAV